MTPLYRYRFVVTLFYIINTRLKDVPASVVPAFLIHQHSQPHAPSSSTQGQECLADLTKPKFDVRRHALGSDGATWFGTKLDVEGVRSGVSSADDVCVPSQNSCSQLIELRVNLITSAESGISNRPPPGRAQPSNTQRPSFW